jgi:hypothetical protein
MRKLNVSKVAITSGIALAALSSEIVLPQAFAKPTRATKKRTVTHKRTARRAVPQQRALPALLAPLPVQQAKRVAPPPIIVFHPEAAPRYGATTEPSSAVGRIIHLPRTSAVIQQSAPQTSRQIPSLQPPRGYVMQPPMTRPPRRNTSRRAVR